MIRLLIAEDSATVQRVLSKLLSGEPGIEIVGIAGDGEQAVQMCKELRPDLVTMDIFMPKMNGLEATRTIMAECPTRIVIISSMVNAQDTNYAFEAMRAGAVEVIEKPAGILSGKYQQIKESLIKVIKTSICTRPDAQLSWLPSIPAPALVAETINEPRISDALVYPVVRPELVCIGGSTGAPTVVAEILAQLPKHFSIPVVVAQHISKGFAIKMCEWLDSSTGLDVQMATADSVPSPGTVLVCPDHLHLTFSHKNNITLIPPANKTGHVPNIDMFFSSVAKTYGKTAVGIILSGMGKDGSGGLLDMHKKNAYTIGQNEETSVVYGMNKVAKEIGAISVELAPHEIATSIKNLGTLKP